MFSQLNRDGELGIRFSKEVQEEKYIKKLGTRHFKSCGAIMKGYVLMLENIWGNLDLPVGYLNKSYDYVMPLEQKKYYKMRE